MTRLIRGKESVYVVDVPVDWRPLALWHVPPSFTGGELVAKNLRGADAMGHARVFNKQQVQPSIAGTPTGRWAIVVCGLRPLHPKKRRAVARHLEQEGGPA